MCTNVNVHVYNAFMHIMHLNSLYDYVLHCEDTVGVKLHL